MQRVASPKIFFSLFFFILCFSLFAHPASAQQQPFNLTTSPNAFDLTVLPGQTIKQTFKIRNNSTTSLPLKIEVKKLIPGIDGQITIADFKKEEDYQHWLTINTASISAAPKEWTFIPFTITVPKTAAFGYYWALLLSPQDTKTKNNNPQTHLTGAVALPILLNVEKDGMKFEGKLEGFKTDRSIYEYLPTNFLTTFTNTGNVHVKPLGSIFIKDWMNRQVAILDINNEQGGILPQGKRTFVSTWNDSFIIYDTTEDGKKKLNMHFDKLLDLRIGKYTATALVVVSGDKRDYSYEASTTFWVFPWKIVLGGIIFLAFAFIGIVSTMKSVGKKVTRLFKKK